MACQMNHAVLDTVSADLAAGEAHSFRASGSTVRDPGFMAVYMEGQDDTKSEEDAEKSLPPLEEGESLALREIVAVRPRTVAALIGAGA